MMEVSGPLYHRNGARLLPSWLARVLIGVAVLAGILELVLGTIVALR